LPQGTFFLKANRQEKVVKGYGSDMKKIFFAALAPVCIALTLFSCRPGPSVEKEVPEETVEDRETGPETDGETVFSGTSSWTGPVGVIISTAYLWELRNDGLMYSANKVRNTGDTVGWKDELIKAKRQTDNVERDFYHIDSDGEDLWVQSYAIAGPDAVPGVVLAENAVLYTRADLAAPASGSILSLPQYTIGAVFPGMDSDQFTGISVYLDTVGTVNKRYIKRQNISADPSDVKSMQLYQLALATTIGIRRRELLNNALEMSGSFGSLIDGALAEIETTVEISETFTVTDDAVSIRERADVESERLGALSKDDIVTAFERTFARWQAGGKTDYWYRIDDGWVFGAYLKKIKLD
jgi:hypothetical protein